MGTFTMTMEERREYARQFVAALGEGWSLEPWEGDIISSDGGGYFDPIGPNGEHLIGYFNPHTRRLSLGAKGLRIPGITVCLSRGPEIAAKEYLRRMTGPLLEALAKEKQEREGWEAHEEEKRAVVTRLQQVPGWTQRAADNFNEVGTHQDNGPYGFVKIHSGSSVEVSLRSVSPELAEKIMRLVSGEVDISDDC